MHTINPTIVDPSDEDPLGKSEVPSCDEEQLVWYYDFPDNKSKNKTERKFSNCNSNSRRENKTKQTKHECFYTHSWMSFIFIHSFIHSFIYLFIYLFVYLFICLFIYLSIYLFMYLHFFNVDKL